MGAPPIAEPTAYRQPAAAGSSLPEGAPRVSAIGPDIPAWPRRDPDIRASRAVQTRSAKPLRPIGSRAVNASPCVEPIIAPHQLAEAATRSNTVGRGAVWGNWLA